MKMMTRVHNGAIYTSSDIDAPNLPLINTTRFQQFPCRVLQRGIVLPFAVPTRGWMGRLM